MVLVVYELCHWNISGYTNVEPAPETVWSEGTTQAAGVVDDAGLGFDFPIHPASNATTTRMITIRTIPTTAHIEVLLFGFWTISLSGVLMFSSPSPVARVCSVRS